MAFIQTTAHRGTENLPFFAKRKRAGERLQAVPAREKIKGRGSAPGHGRMSSTERLTGQGSGHSPKPRAVVVYGPSPGHLFLQRRAYKPDKEAGTAQSQGPLLSTASPRGTSPCNADLLGRTRERALPNDKRALMCMASPRGTVSGNADLLGRTRQRALPAEGHPLRTWRGPFGSPPAFLPYKRHIKPMLTVSRAADSPFSQG